MEVNTLFSNHHINLLIVARILDGTETWNYSMLRRLYRLFGKSRDHQLFLECARQYFFEYMFRRYKVTNVCALVHRKIRTSLQSHTTVFDEFKRGIEEHRECIIIESPLNRADRCIVRYLALYYGYLYLCREKLQCDFPGDAYERIHDSPAYKNQVIAYEFLRRRHINNLAYYDLVIDSPHRDKRAYRLKDTFLIKGIGFTVEFHYAECIKVLDLAPIACQEPVRG